MNKKILKFLSILVALLFLGSFYKNYILSSIIPGYNNNPICKSHPLMASQDIYEIPSSSSFGKGLIVKVEDWGDFTYTYKSIKFDVNNKECVASSFVTAGNKSGVLISIGNNLNSGYIPIIKIRLDLYLYASSKSSDVYDAEQTMKDLANNFLFSRNSNGLYELKLKDINAADTLSTKGAWVFQNYDDDQMFDFENFKLLSQDGITWKLAEHNITE